MKTRRKKANGPDVLTSTPEPLHSSGANGSDGSAGEALQVEHFLDTLADIALSVGGRTHEEPDA